MSGCLSRKGTTHIPIKNRGGFKFPINFEQGIVDYI